MDREYYLEVIVELIEDYREGELPRPTHEHIERWLQQFDQNVQFHILREMEHVLFNSYISRSRMAGFYWFIHDEKELVGDSPYDFWKNVNFLNIQIAGASQKELLSLFSEVLSYECGLEVGMCGTQANNYSTKPKIFVYLDDAIFTGNRVRRDLEKWLYNDAPNHALLHVIVNTLYKGSYYNTNKLEEEIKKSGKQIRINWHYETIHEDRKSYTDTSDVLRPVKIPADGSVQEYIKAMRYKPHFRNAGHVGNDGVFSNDAGRQLLEQEFLKAGVRIRRMCPHLQESQRPLGHTSLESLGFGSLIVTFRNCPNNAPLALWAGAPWYPLFPRKTNSDTSTHHSSKTLEEDIFL